MGDGFGEGYVAACLAALAFDTNAVVSRLLDGRPPPEVAHLSPQLADVALAKPRTLRAAAPPPDAAFAAQQKARARRLERDDREAEELRLLAGGLYDDDYDDRYDGPDDPIVAATALGDQLCANQIFNPTSMCAYATVSMQALRPGFENSTRAIDPSKNQPNRLRFDRAREFSSLVRTTQTSG